LLPPGDYVYASFYLTVNLLKKYLGTFTNFLGRLILTRNKKMTFCGLIHIRIHNLVARPILVKLGMRIIYHCLILLLLQFIVVKP